MLNRLAHLIINRSPMAISTPVPSCNTALESYKATSANQALSGKKEVATFAHGCFWGTQQVFEKYYGKERGILTSTVGYTGGNETSKPTYQQVCTGRTNHAEAVRIEFDPELVGYSELVEFFYRTHDPTRLNRQGNDVGTQYRSCIFTHSAEQENIAKQVTEEIQKLHFDKRGEKIVTSIEPAPLWYDAEEYHQFYLDRNPGGYHCSTHVLHW